MATFCWPYFDPEYENFSNRINPPRVSVDNASCHDCTLIKVDSVNKPGILLEVVQILTDLDFIITKAYISSDGGWFMDVFHVTDQQGKKITDIKTIDFIEKALGPKGQSTECVKSWPAKRVGVHSVGDHTAIELIGRDRPGLLSEISAVLANLQFNVIAAEVWTHNRRVACVLYVNDATNGAGDDLNKLSVMEEQLNNILRGCEEDEKVARTSFSMGFTHMDRRLHQMLFADRDYECAGLTAEVDYPPSSRPKITIERCEEKGYSVVSVKCKDRAKLMFDIVCTLTDMQYVVFHATISSDGPHASQEYFIRHMDGCTLDTEGEEERVIKCIEAAIQRRVSEVMCGLKLISMLFCNVTKKKSGKNFWFSALTESFLNLTELMHFAYAAIYLYCCNGTAVTYMGLGSTQIGVSLELCAKDRVGLLSEVTRILRENGLTVCRAGISTIGEQALNVFYVRDASGNPVDTKIVETLRKEIGQTMMVKVKRVPANSKVPETRGWTKTSFFFGNLLERFLS
ncbi:ACT domain-containing protein ACR3-like isoform X1 [Senna tora]|uniref:ACT domain-containing protein ACR n=1 Tax=Senna tora TaxID=362788 RepID=A0A834T9K6_9FABA|nr:ACT domain-containing protein ACR3-like isoform X1 [Senna tora]